ncbi:MAG: hypothetical protein MK132_08775 [Lentisphaerales bacterium]|nr:hypothetical protein [Lentisphaerales bacterium]
MAVHIEHSKKHDFILSTAVGLISDQLLLEHVYRLNTLSELYPGFNELADCRYLEDVSGLSGDGARTCALVEKYKEGSKLAILVDDSPLIYAMARTYEIFAESKRDAVEIFICESEALAWLEYDDEEICELKKMIYNSNLNSVAK